MSLGNNHIDPEDLFTDTRMSFGDHLEDLRLHLWRAILGFLVALGISFFIGRTVLEFISQPVEKQLNEFYDRRFEKKVEELRAGTNEDLNARNLPQEVAIEFSRDSLAKLGLNLPAAGDPWVSLTAHIQLNMAIALRNAEMVIGRRPGSLATFRVEEAFMVYFKVCLVSALVIGSPWIFWQLWSFVAAGLYPHEKRLVNVYLPFSLALFLGGVAICQLAVIPNALKALLWFNEWLGFEPDLRLSEWLGFAIMMPLVFGISFQTPLVMYFLQRVGILTIETYREKRRLAWFLLAVFAAVMTPSMDAVSMLWLWVPLGLLYELGIVLCRFMPGSPDLEIDVPDPGEPVEV